jgi:beta-lactamase regulating signal transducer with metallopeptidase domain
MVLSLFVATAQISVGFLVSWCLARYWQNRDPEVAVYISFTGLLLGVAVAACTVLSVPRPLIWRLSSPTVSHADFSTDRESPVSLTPGLNLAPNTKRDNSNHSGLGFPVQRWIQTLILRPSVVSESLTVTRCIGVFLVAGFLWQFGTIAVGTVELLRLKRSSCEVNERDANACLQQLCRIMQVKKQPMLRQHVGVDHPCVSWLEPQVIYLPNHFVSWTPLEFEAALAHEIAHTMRRDGFWRYLSRLCTALLWCHPIAWVLHRQLCLAQEINADQQARKSVPNGNYLRGLAALALRMDASARNRAPRFGVSVVTSDLIRRIEMLRRPELRLNSHTRPFAKASLALLSVVALCCLAWSVEADEPLRIAAKLPDQPIRRQTQFQRTPLSPWESLPQSEGYAAIRFDDLVQHPYAKAWVPQANAMLRVGFAALGMEPEQVDKLVEHGIEVENLRLAQTCVKASLSHSHSQIAPDDDAEEEIEQDKQQFSLAANHVILETHSPIAWSSLIPAVSISRIAEFLGPDAQPVVQEVVDRLMATPSDTTRLVLCNEPICGDEVSEATATAWRAVDGGLITFAIDVPTMAKDILEHDDQERSHLGVLEVTSISTSEASDAPRGPATDDAASREQMKLLRMIQCVGLGVDQGTTANEIQLRVACIPVTGVSAKDVEAQWQRFVALAKHELENTTTEELGESDFAIGYLKSVLALVPSSMIDSDPLKAQVFQLSGPISLP